MRLTSECRLDNRAAANMYNGEDWSGSIQKFSSALFSGLYCFKYLLRKSGFS